jgi:lipopolysaccharide transport system ATP-binding protein
VNGKNMSDIAIRVENLSKKYRIGVNLNKRNLREAIKDSFKKPIRRIGRFINKTKNIHDEDHQTIWALNQVGFQIKQGDRIGIIGRNGSGKSTLLKILSRITEPTNGFAEIQGRVRSLLEVGTGFHPELTGRENIYLNGAILGMKKAEINVRFDEIVDFSEVEKFIDTPVKHYSSGMYLRLAFAVAAHLESEILIVDEVLAVGDGRFQRKCLDKMQEVGSQGRTVLFVSHNMPAVIRLCNRALLLDEGRLVGEGPAHQIVRNYSSGGLNSLSAERVWENPQKRPGGEAAQLRVVRVKKEDGQLGDSVDINNSIEIEMEYDVLKPGFIFLPHYHLLNEEGIIVFTSFDVDPEWRKKYRPVGRFTSRVLIPGNLLQPGLYVVHAALITWDPFIVQCYEQDAVAFQVIDSDDGGLARGDYTGDIGGVVRPLLKWTTLFTPAEKHAAN